jgi:inorganic pyrophosphatase
MDEPLQCLIEIPKGSRNKYEWDDALGEDGDPLDAMVCVSEPTFSGCLIPVTAIAIDSWYERDVALKVIEESRARWRETRS